MLYKTDETGTDFRIECLHFALDFLILRDLITLFSATLDGSLSLTLHFTRTCDQQARILACFMIHKFVTVFIVGYIFITVN